MDPERAAGEPHQQSSGFWHGTRRNFSAPSSVLEYIQMIVQMFNSDDYPIITVIYPPCPTVKLCGWETQFVAPTGSPFFCLTEHLLLSPQGVEKTLSCDAVMHIPRVNSHVYCVLHR